MAQTYKYVWAIVFIPTCKCDFAQKIVLNVRKRLGENAIVQASMPIYLCVRSSWYEKHQILSKP